VSTCFRVRPHGQMLRGSVQALKVSLMSHVLSDRNDPAEGIPMVPLGATLSSLIATNLGRAAPARQGMDSQGPATDEPSGHCGICGQERGAVDVHQVTTASSDGRQPSAGDPVHHDYSSSEPARGT